MSAHLLGTWPTGSPEWLEARRGRLGGSEVAAVMGLSPFESRFSLWHRKRGDIGPAELNPAMEWGNRLEAVVAHKFTEDHPELAVRRSGVWQNKSRPWQVGTPDRLMYRYDRPTVSEVLEVKTARYDDGWGEPGTDQIPVHYRCQVLWYLDTLDLTDAWVAVLIAGSDYREYRITVDDDARSDIMAMRLAAERFIADLDNDVRPDIDSHAETYEAIKELHPDIDPSSVDVPDDVGKAVILTRRNLKAAEDSHRQAKSELADHMGSAHYAYWRGVKIADRRARAAEGSIPYVQLVNKLPDLTLEKA